MFAGIYNIEISCFNSLFYFNLLSTCGKKFSHVSHYYRHERIHTGVKPYKCDVCNKSFNQSNALKSHRKTHFREEVPTMNVCVEN